jgi:hypothetical protein
MLINDHTVVIKVIQCPVTIMYYHISIRLRLLDYFYMRSTGFCYGRIMGRISNIDTDYRTVL